MNSLLIVFGDDIFLFFDFLTDESLAIQCGCIFPFRPANRLGSFVLDRLFDFVDLTAQPLSPRIIGRKCHRKIRIFAAEVNQLGSESRIQRGLTWIRRASLVARQTGE